MNSVPFDDTKFSSDDVLKGVSEWQETNDIDGSWAMSLEEETKGTKIAVELRAECNNLTKEERKKSWCEGIQIVYESPFALTKEQCNIVIDNYNEQTYGRKI